MASARQSGVAAAIVMALLLSEADARQPASSPSGLRIVVIAGEDAVNIIQQKTAVAPVVEIRDRNNLPVPGAVVTFAIEGGQAASFGGAPTLTVTANAAGQAAVTGLTPASAGAMQIQVSAAFQGQTAAATITQTNVLTAAQAVVGAGAASGAGAATGAGAVAAAGGLSTGAVAGIVGGIGAAAGGVVVTRGATRTDATRPPPTATAPVTEPRPEPTAAPTPTPEPRPDPTPTPAPRPDPVPAPAPTPRPDPIRCSFSVTPRTVNAPGSGGTATVSVTVAPAGCDDSSWVVTNVPSFVEATPLSGRGDGTVALTIRAHDGSFERTDAISIAGSVVNLVQPPRSGPRATTCVSESRQGRDDGEARTFDLGQTSATFAFTFNPGASNANRMIVSYEGRPLLDTGCAVPPPARMMWLTYSGRMSTVTVQVIPNCAGGNGTAWEYHVSCPR